MIRYLSFVLLLCSVASANTYYVDSVGGSDSNTGTAISAPIQTIAKVNALGLVACDSVLFKAGDTWTLSSSLTVSASGLTSCVITFGSYGTGADPILDAAGVASAVMDVGSSSNISIRHLQGKNAVTWGFIGHGSNITLDHTSFTMDSGYTVLGWAYQWKTLGSVTFTNNHCDLLNSGSDPGCFDVEGSSNVLMQYNSASGGSQSYTIKPYAECASGPAVNGGNIVDNESDSVTTANGGDGQAIELEGCAAYPQSAVVVAHNIISCGSKTDSGIAGYYSTKSVIWDNVIVGACETSFFHFSSYSIQNSFFNNTVTGSGAEVPYGFYFLSGSTATLKNNIVDWTRNAFEFVTGASASEDYDELGTHIHRNTVGVSIGTHTLRNNEPKFVNEPPIVPNDVRLRPGSPAIGAGWNLGSSYNQALSATGAPIPYGTFEGPAGWTIGAFAFPSPAATSTRSGAKLEESSSNPGGCAGLKP
jgi:hypothetical protein